MSVLLRRSSLSVALMAAAVPAACGESTAPAPAVPGTYVLDAVSKPVGSTASDTLPTLLWSTPSSGSYFIVADTLVLRPDGSFRDTERDSSMSYAHRGDAYPTVPSAGSSTVEGTWSATGDQVTLQYGPDPRRYFAPGSSFTGPLTSAGRYTQTRPAQLGTSEYVWTRR